MKLLGQFELDEGNEYLDLLKENRIDVEAEDVFVEHTGYKGQSYVIVQLQE